MERKGLFGILFFIVGLFMFYALVISNLLNGTLNIRDSFLGVLFLGCFCVPSIGMMKQALGEARKKSRLKARGRKVFAKVIEVGRDPRSYIKQNTGPNRNIRIPACYLICEMENEVGRTYRSGNFFGDHILQKYPVGSLVPVYINLDNKDEYFVDIENDEENIRQGNERANKKRVKGKVSGRSILFMFIGTAVLAICLYAGAQEQQMIKESSLVDATITHIHKEVNKNKSHYEVQASFVNPATDQEEEAYINFYDSSMKEGKHLKLYYYEPDHMLMSKKNNFEMIGIGILFFVVFVGVGVWEIKYHI